MGKEIQYISNIIKDKYNADIIEIKDLNRKNGFFNNLRNNYTALKNNYTKISPETVDFSKYNLILIGCPSTLGNISPALNTLLNNCDLNGKNVIIYITTNSSQGHNVLKQIKKQVDIKGGQVINSFIIRVNNKTKQELLVNTIQLLPQLDIDLYL